MSLADKFYGVMLGCAIGDAIGELASSHRSLESLNDWLSEGDTLRYTDDTAMSIGIAEALIENQKIDQNKIGKVFEKNYAKEPWRSYSPSTPNIFARVKRQQINFSEAAKQLYDGEGSMGNGAAMRIAPLGILYSNSKHLIANSEISAKITHSHPIGIDGALSMSYAISILTNLDKKDQFPLDKFCKGLIKVCRSKEMQSNFLLVFESLASNKEPLEVAKALNLSQKAHESVPFSIYAFLKFKTSFEESLYCSILNGGDQDTLGSMTASLSGAYLGKRELPQNWLDRIENKDYIESLAIQLFKLSETIS